jgi:hypothetical protein
LRASCYKMYALLKKILENYLYISLSFPFNSNEEILMGAVFFFKVFIHRKKPVSYDVTVVHIYIYSVLTLPPSPPLFSSQ